MQSSFRAIKGKIRDRLERGRDMLSTAFRNFIINNPKAAIFAVAVAGVLVILVIVCVFIGKQSKPDPPKEDSCYYVHSYVWNMGTASERKAGILYDKKHDRFWKKDKAGDMTEIKNYSGTSRKPMKFSFSEESAGDSIFESCDIGAGDIYHETLDQAERGYASLIEDGYKNLLTITEAGSTDVYLQKGQDYYRYLTITGAGGNSCIVTFSKIPRETWEHVSEREVE